ncbi:MAG: hypothetical protein P8X90_33480 [Desulfobacterales bacterium]
MKKQYSSAPFARKASTAIAIFKDGIIAYASDAFEKLLNPLKSRDKQEFNCALRDVNKIQVRASSQKSPDTLRS